MGDERCSSCERPLMYEMEIEFGVCERCSEAMYERSQQRTEWGYYHPGEPCPESELTPLPTTSVCGEENE